MNRSVLYAATLTRNSAMALKNLVAKHQGGSRISVCLPALLPAKTPPEVPVLPPSEWEFSASTLRF